MKNKLAYLGCRINDFYLLDNRDRNYAIEGLRGLAMLMVLNCHFFAMFKTEIYFSSEIPVLHAFFLMLHSGYLGVDIFYVLSGFLAWKILFKDKKIFAKYIKDRINRLMPSYILNLIIVSFACFSLKQFIENVFFISEFLPGKTFYNYVSWSLGWEWLFYSIILFTAYLFKRKKKTSLFILFLITGINVFFSYYIKPQNVILPEPLRFSGFLLGCVLSEYFSYLKNKVFYYLGYISIAIVFLLCLYKGMYQNYIISNDIKLGLYYLFFDIWVCFLIAFLLNYKSFLSKLFELKMIRIFGQISYTFYLTHSLIGIPISKSIYNKVNNIPTMLISYLITIIVTFIISSFLFYFTERNYLLNKRNQR